MAAADTAKLIASLSLQDKGFTKGLSNAEKGLGRLESTAFRVGQNIGGGLKTAASNLAKIGTIGAIGATGLLVKSVQEASSLNEQLNKTSAVFGDAAESVKAFSKTTADALGLSQVEALEAAGAYGNMFKTVGLTEKQSAEFSKTLVGLAADMASFNDEDPSEMLDKLRSGLAGEAEPLRQFGVLLSEAEVKAEAYRTGIAKTGEALTEAQKVQARYSLILKQTAVQQGDFSKTSNGMANVMRRLKANLRDAGATIGTALLPKVTELAVKFNNLVKDNGPAIQAFADKLPGAFDKALAFAEEIPWETIGKGMEQAAFFTGKLIDAFLSMPPEVQTTLIALAGLNKLSGGAITGIVSELGKGLIKGVLGINAGHVTVNAATVSGAGGLAGAGAAGAAGPGRLAQAANLVMKVAIVGIAADVANTLSPVINEAGVGIHDTVFGKGTGLFGSGIQFSPSDLSWPFGPKNTPSILPEIFGGNGLLGGNAQKPVENKRLNEQKILADVATKQNITNERLEAIKGYTSDQSTSVSNLLRSSERNETAIKDSKIAGQQAAFAIRDKVAGSGSLIAGAVNAAKAVAQTTTAAAREAGRQTAAAVRDKDLSVSLQNSVTVNTRVSVRETIESTTTHKQYSRYLS